ncbi:MAG: hypothetical protein E4H03_12125 [Myxococcales bacterium]|jgi:hypothetical protein|nr:MAG: hypothetical protein E4H03_12125 [Myxococcales bacterium]
MRITPSLLALTVVACASATAAAQPIIDVGACARYEHAAGAKRTALEDSSLSEADAGMLREDIAVLESALELCSDYFHLQANYTALKKRCPDAK